MTSADPLGTLLVKDGVLPAARVEDAHERTVLLGGTLDTALLELGLIDEARLLPLLSRAYGARALSRADLFAIDRTMAQVFPRRLAEKHNVVPVDVSGRRLTLVLTGRPDLALLDEIGFMLSVYVKPAVTLEARLAWIRARLYGGDVPVRMQAILKALGETDVAIKPREQWSAKSTGQRTQPPAPAPAPAEPVPAPFPPTPQASTRSVADGTAKTNGKHADESGWAVAHNVSLTAAVPSAPKAAQADTGASSIEAQSEAKEIRERPPSADEKRKKERVLWTVDDAIAELALADERDPMLDVVLRFAYRRLSTVAIFILLKTKDHSELVAWDLIDPLLTKNDVGALPIPATGKHALAQVVDMQSPFLGPLKPGDPLARLFGRQPRACLLMPIMVGDRLAGVLYGDAGTRSIPPSTMAELHMVVPRLGKGLKNLILRKKKQLRADTSPDKKRGKKTDLPAPAEQPVLEREEQIEVSPVQRGSKRLTIEIDIEDIENAKAESSLASASMPPALAESASAPIAAVTDPPAQTRVREELEAPSGLSIETGTPMAWADGKGDDEDVHLDESAYADLSRQLAPPKKITARMQLDLVSIDDQIADAPADSTATRAAPGPDAAATRDAAAPPASNASAWADGGEDDEQVKLEDSALAALEMNPKNGRASQRLDMAALALALDDEPDGAEAHRADGLSDTPRSLDDDDDPIEVGDDDFSDDAPLASIPEGEPMPGPADHASGERGPSAALPPEPAVTADSPGASARESLLLATWQDWLKHEDDTLDHKLGALQLKKDGSKEEKTALNAIIGYGARAMPSLARYFPGALSVHPFGAMERRPEVHELSDCLQCMVKLGAQLAAPILCGELGHEDRLHRWTATYALSVLRVPGALARLAQRVFDPEPAIASLALEVLDGYRAEEGFARVLTQLRDLLRRGDLFERARAVQAVAELKDRDALLGLVDLLGTKPKDLADDARRALIDITKQDFGNAERRWRAWIADNESVPRTRWLIDGLGHKDEDIRRGAQAELNAMTGEYFGYRWDAARADRDAGVQAWHEWWERQLVKDTKEHA